MIEVLVVAIFGGLGALLRNWLGLWKGKLPWGILIANTLATAVAAAALVLDPRLSLMLIVGLAGGLSTFSTFVAQTWQLLHDGKRVSAFTNVVLNIIFPSTAVAIVVLCLPSLVN